MNDGKQVTTVTLDVAGRDTVARDRPRRRAGARRRRRSLRRHHGAGRRSSASARRARTGRFLPADGRLRRENVRRRQDSRRIHQARRPADRERDSRGASDRPPDSPALPEGLPRRSPGHHHGPLGRSGKRSGIALDHRRVGGADDLARFRSTGRSARCASAMFDGEIVINPTCRTSSDSDLDMVVAGTADAIMMVEGEAERDSGGDAARRHRARARGDQADLSTCSSSCSDRSASRKVGRSPPPQKNTSSSTRSRARCSASGCARPSTTRTRSCASKGPTKSARARSLSQLSRHRGEKTSGRHRRTSATRSNRILKEEVRGGILERRRSPRWPHAGRDSPDLDRGRLPAAHSWLGDLHPRSDAGAHHRDARLDGRRAAARLDLARRTSKRYIHHYNFPPFSVGEVRRLRGAGRRDIGHGALAERALLAVLPDEDEFPYTMRLVSEVLSSNGSTSMASVCGSTLALMDAGVPIAAPVAGIAMGLVTDGDRRPLHRS